MKSMLELELEVQQQVARLPRHDGALRRRAERLKAGASISGWRLDDIARAADRQARTVTLRGGESASITVVGWKP